LVFGKAKGVVLSARDCHRTNVKYGFVINILYKSVFSFLHQLITWHCPHLATACRCCGAAAAGRLPPACSNRSLYPVRRPHRGKPAARAIRHRLQRFMRVRAHTSFYCIRRRTWSVTQTLQKRLDSFEQRGLRRILRVSFRDRCSNAEVRLRIGDRQSTIARR